MFAVSQLDTTVIAVEMVFFKKKTLEMHEVIIGG
jgi:hypothetical protein